MNKSLRNETRTETKLKMYKVMTMGMKAGPLSKGDRRKTEIAGTKSLRRVSDHAHNNTRVYPKVSRLNR